MRPNPERAWSTLWLVESFCLARAGWNQLQGGELRVRRAHRGSRSWTGAAAVLAWRLSNTPDSDFCVETLEDALAHHGRAEIFNTDQGAQFTSMAFTDVLKGASGPRLTACRGRLSRRQGAMGGQCSWNGCGAV